MFDRCGVKFAGCGVVGTVEGCKLWALGLALTYQSYLP